ncbi:uncharacterized protein [Argopecten irradians]|uniref:uncharacterized protein n=1 Tax=Argopecten irradians TaxID=31199 RepID=UPI003713C639
MERIWIFLCILFLCTMFFSYKTPFHFLRFCGETFYNGLKPEASNWCRGCTIVLIEFLVQGVKLFSNEYICSIFETKSERLAVKANAVTQTTGTWLKKLRRQDRIYSEAARIAKEEARGTRKHRLTLVKKYKLKLSNIKNEGESKSKLMASVNKKVVSLALEVDGLMHRIQEKRFILEKQREDNKRVLQRYEQLYQDIQNRYMYE